jgi:DNA repair exonuclease SbcCD ATPase subunit
MKKIIFTFILVTVNLVCFSQNISSILNILDEKIAENVYLGEELRKAQAEIIKLQKERDNAIANEKAVIAINEKLQDNFNQLQKNYDKLEQLYDVLETAVDELSKENATLKNAMIREGVKVVAIIKSQKHLCGTFDSEKHKAKSVDRVKVEITGYENDDNSLVRVEILNGSRKQVYDKTLQLSKGYAEFDCFENGAWVEPGDFKVYIYVHGKRENEISISFTKK